MRWRLFGAAGEGGPASNKAVRANSLRVRLALALTSVLLPFMLTASLGMVYLLPALLAPMEAIVVEMVDEMEPVRRLQLGLLTAAIGARGGRGGPDTAELQVRIDKAFDEVQLAQRLTSDERALIHSARREWQHAVAVYSDNSVSVSAGARARIAAAHAESASAIVDGVYALTRAEMQRQRSVAEVAKKQTLWVTVLAFTLAFGISVYAGMRFAVPFLADVDSLRQSAIRFANGELTHRVSAIRTEDLSDLAAAFNVMGEQIQQNQTALFELATRDGLTGLLNRREFLRLLRDEINRARRYGRSFAVLLLDIDHFKKVNDSWGHPAGDEVLRCVAGRIMNELRPTDRAGRYGGEEFAILLTETGLDAATTAAERIRAAIARGPVDTPDNGSIAVTVSIGIAAFPQAGSEETALISVADRNLYSAKAAGRNCVIASAEGQPGDEDSISG